MPLKQLSCAKPSRASATKFAPSTLRKFSQVFLIKLFYVQWLYFLALRVLVLVVGSFLNVYLAILGFFIRIYFACTLVLFLDLSSKSCGVEKSTRVAPQLGL